MECLGAVETIDACYIPDVAMTACQYDALPRIAADETCLIPDGGQLSEELLNFLWLGQETLWTVGKML